MKHLRPAILLTLFFVLVTGLAFPMVVTGISQVVFPHQANGSLIKDAQGNVVGSELIGQSFAKPEYFHPRPSAAGNGYDAANSSGTNLGPTSDKLINGIPDDPKTKADESYVGVKQLADAYRKENNLPASTLLPTDAVTRSASGLDPHISPANAELQAPRVAAARKIGVDKVKELIKANTDGAFAGVFGDPGVNVLKLNRALDAKIIWSAPSSWRFAPTPEACLTYKREGGFQPQIKAARAFRTPKSGALSKDNIANSKRYVS